ncbi:translocation/assembly module TamB domain-containing protein [Limibaculum sp. FT325]|uniref:translocation/assembly module TamB domain-containing protein n=1 Tax=Thermohalobaculum sediminis TaxID=2939436 RepID=UPI0020BEA04D|nr:translocation/assembly module TamB [Limibaculum sediminis]MCL5777381.1 translocation/assembly module TamB domain-containing protein [Limibaculum sediminis]
MRARALIAVLGVALVLAGAPALAQFSLLGLKNSLVQFALERISVPGELEITAAGVEESEDGSTALVGVAFADADGVWMRIGALSLRWNPRRILRGELDIESIVAADVEVLRRPGATPEVKEDAVPAEERGLFEWPRAPLTLHLREMRLDRVRVAEGVIAGQSLAFDATGALRDEGDEQSLRLQLQRADAVAGRIALDYLRTFEANTLKLDLAAEEAAGGLVAELAGFPPGSASRVSVAADGPLTDWRLSVDAAAEQVFELDGRAVVEASGRLLVDGDFVLVPGPAIDPAAASVLGERAELAFRVAEAEDGSGLIRVERGSLSSPHLTLDASGTYALPTGAADLAVNLRGGPGLAVLVEGVDFGGFGFEGRVAGVVPGDFTAEGALSLDGLETEPADVGRARLATTVSMAGERVGFDVDGGVAGLRLDRLTSDLLGETGLRAAGAFDAGVLTLEALALDSPLLALEARGQADTGAGRAALDYALRAPELGPVARAYDVVASGGLDVEGRVEGPFEAIGIKGFARLADLVFEGEGYGTVTLDHDVTVVSPPPPAPGAAAPEGSVAGRVAVTADGSRYGPAEVATDFLLAGQTLALESMTARALGLTARGEATVDLATTLAEGALDLAVPDLGTLAPLTEQLAGQRLAGALDGRVTLAAPGGRQDAGLDLRLRDFAGFEARLARLGIRGGMRDALGAPEADVTLTLSDARHPQASLATGEVTAELTDLVAAPAGRVTFALDGIEAPGTASLARLTGTADLADLAADPSGRVEFRAEGLDAAGAASVAAITGQGSFAGVTTTPTGRLDASAQRVEAGGIAVRAADLAASLDAAGTLDARLAAPSVAGDGLAVSGAEVTARIGDALGEAPVLDVRARAARAEAAPLALAPVTASLRGPLGALAIAADASGEAALGRGDPKPASLILRVTANAATPDLSARVSEARARVGEAEMALRAPLAIGVAGGVTRLRGIDLGLPGGGLTGALAVHPAGLGGELVLLMDDLAALAAALGDLDIALPLAGGRVDARAAFDTRPGAARADASVTGRDLLLDKAIADIGGLGLDAQARWDGRRAEAEAALSGPFGDPVRATAALPLRPTPGIVPQIPRGGEIDGSLRWQGRLGDLWALVPVPDHILDGNLDIDLAVSGPVGSPAIGGSVAMTDGQYQNLETGTILTNLTLGSSLDGQGGIVLDLEARDGANGTVEARVALDAEAVDATLTAREAVLVRRDDVRAQISADIAARGPLAGPAVTGRINVDRAELRLVNATPPSVADLGEVRFKGDPVPEPVEPAGDAVTLDLKVEGPRNIFVRGRGLDSEWRLGLDVAGTAAAPRITGAVERIRGQLDLLGRDFELETGEVRFTGGTEIDPILAVVLAHERDGFIGRIEVRGNASNPQIGFTSDPQVPEEEVLPRTLFGRSRQSLSPTEAIQLANALATLLSGSGGVVDSLHGAAGIDVLRIDDDGDGASVTVGKNVADGVFVGAKQPIDGGSATVQVEVEVFDDFSVDGEVGEEHGSSIGLNWRKDF